MTAGDFAKKYGLPYQIVRSATFRTSTRQMESWRLDYEEPELKRAVRDEMKDKLKYYQDNCARVAGYLKKLEVQA